ncbi:MAG: hypothetical protein LBT44_04340, partial [Clostridiales bacterium]|nr:hypothetical protein [Clostridiales bacterium]
MEFANQDEAKAWIIRNQFARRNISDVTRSRLALELKNMIAAQAKENLTTSTGGTIPRPLFNLTKAAPVNTREKIAEIAGVSGSNIYRVETVDAKAPESVKKAMEDGVISIHKAYKATKAAQKDPDVKRKLEITPAAQIPEALLTDMEETNRLIKRQGKIMDTWCMMARMDYSDDDYEIWLSDLSEDAIERQLEMS